MLVKLFNKNSLGIPNWIRLGSLCSYQRTNYWVDWERLVGFTNFAEPKASSFVTIIKIRG